MSKKSIYTPATIKKDFNLRIYCKLKNLFYICYIDHLIISANSSLARSITLPQSAETASCSAGLSALLLQPHNSKRQTIAKVIAIILFIQSHSSSNWTCQIILRCYNTWLLVQQCLLQPHDSSNNLHNHLLQRK